MAVWEACPAPGVGTRARGQSPSARPLRQPRKSRQNRTGGCLPQGPAPPQRSKLACEQGIRTPAHGQGRAQPRVAVGQTRFSVPPPTQPTREQPQHPSISHLSPRQSGRAPSGGTLGTDMVELEGCPLPRHACRQPCPDGSPPASAPAAGPGRASAASPPVHGPWVCE